MWWTRTWSKLCSIYDIVSGLPAMIGTTEGVLLNRLNQIDHRVGAMSADLHKRLDAIARQAGDIKRLEDTGMASMQDVLAALSGLNDKVGAQSTVIGSAETLLTEIKSALDTALANTDPTQALAQIAAISDKIGTDTDTLTQSVVANTPAADPPPPPPAGDGSGGAPTA